MQKHLIQIMILVLLLILVLGGCTPAYRLTSDNMDLTVAPTAPIVAYDKAEVYRAIAASPWQSAPRVSEISSNRIPLWTIHTSLKDYRPNRALAIGYPYDCGCYWHYFGSNSEASAAAAALSGCLDNLRGIEKHTGHRCGARLVLVNQKLLVSAEELPIRFRVPFIMEVRPLTGEKFSIYGMFEFKGPGQNSRWEVFNEKGEKVCTGRYSLSNAQTFSGSGDFNINCFDDKIIGQGTLSVKKLNLRHMFGQNKIGIGKGRTSDGSEMKFFTGIPIDQYEEYRDLLE